MAAFDFGGRQVLVTGGSSGIGNAIARAFRDAGAAVVVTGTQEAGFYESDVAGMRFHRLDLADEAAAAALVAGLPRLDVLVNNAGTAEYKRREYQMPVFRRVLDVNLGGPMLLANQCYEKLRFTRGNVVNIASLSAFFGNKGNPAYGASKAGLLQLTRSLAVAWGPDGIRVNAIAPGYVETKLTQVTKRNAALDAAIVARTPLGRWGRAEEMASAVLFLASDHASFVTGATLTVDGGYSAVV
ncbi:MAG: SDR family oxidoreductase [Alphaproteobacteria bacterium]|nr:SDR family oxidoreductase [Alphaproteobacteria bacterium]